VSYYTGEPIEETRQEYVNQRIQQFQRAGLHDGSFGQLLGAFREYGHLYDEGHRRRDLPMAGEREFAS
jgi:hypothetical protein